MPNGPRQGGGHQDQDQETQERAEAKKPSRPLGALRLGQEVEARPGLWPSDMIDGGTRLPHAAQPTLNGFTPTEGQFHGEAPTLDLILGQTEVIIDLVGMKGGEAIDLIADNLAQVFPCLAGQDRGCA